jgi:hypothetical protein
MRKILLLAGFPQRIDRFSDACSFILDNRMNMPPDANVDDPLAQKKHDVDALVEAGESEKTPFILIGRVWVVTAAAVAVIFAIVIVAYYLAT